MIVCFSPDTFNFLDIGTVNKLVLTKLESFCQASITKRE